VKAGDASGRGTVAGYRVPAMSNVDIDQEGVRPKNRCIGEAQCALGNAGLRHFDAGWARRDRIDLLGLLTEQYLIRAVSTLKAKKR
jgi:hypothetical protein